MEDILMKIGKNFKEKNIKIFSLFCIKSFYKKKKNPTQFPLFKK